MNSVILGKRPLEEHVPVIRGKELRSFNIGTIQYAKYENARYPLPEGSLLVGAHSLP